jgi:CheY-like chemotaxis protein/predicted regulator of Ras-like GTPase activity (Roadblock/LC7/MglB family)
MASEPLNAMGGEMSPVILVVDPNEAFATLLKDLLETENSYTVKVAENGSAAMSLLGRETVDLTIVDVDLDPEDMTCRELIRAIRRLHPSMRIVVIPLMGEELPPEAQELDIQGSLSKPFFADDLLPRIEEALSRQVGKGHEATRAQEEEEEEEEEGEERGAEAEKARAVPLAAERKRPPQLAAEPDAEIRAVLAELARETQAETTLLISAAAGQQEVMGHSATLRDAELEKLAGYILALVETGQAAGRFAGQGDSPFEHNMLEGASSRLYVMVLSSDLLLVTVTPSQTPLGTVRHNQRRAARQLGFGR